MTPVKSSSLEAIGHDRHTNILSVKFIGGKTYHYAGVTADDHDKLMSAPSIGSHFQRKIRGAFKEVKGK